MQIDANTLPSLMDFDKFKDLFERHAKSVTRPMLLKPIFSLARERDAHYAWREDLTRVEARERKLTEGLDHFKQSAHLAYWLRRQAPIVEYEDWAKYEEGGLALGEEETREFIAKYGTELVAFDFGFKICAYYEEERSDGKKKQPPKLSMSYLEDVCYMLKFKHVSPHSLYLIYRSIFSP
ncbi:MAG TPA: hypothetical protein VNW15_12610 [Rhizomicrobium sp.]|jgi:hypothetical protein|nr:hypothetical protein [Rhizomicrobium sp.]